MSAYIKVMHRKVDFDRNGATSALLRNWTMREDAAFYFLGGKNHTNLLS